MTTMLERTIRRAALCATIAVVPWATTASPAFAQCAFDSGHATKIASSMVAPHAACEATPYLVGDTPACDPVPAASAYTLENRATCKVQMGSKIFSDCSRLRGAGGSLGLPPGPCHDTIVKAKCSGIRTLGGGQPIGPDDAGWSLVLDLRLTTNDGEDRTFEDVSMTRTFSPPESGRFLLRSSLAEWRVQTLGAELASLSPCTEVEVLDVRVVDPDGVTFAVFGVATR